MHAQIVFLEACVIEIPGTGEIFAAEPRVTGEYKKHSNNAGWRPPHGRNTPQAFSHWTYCKCASAKQMLVLVLGHSVPGQVRQAWYLLRYSFYRAGCLSKTAGSLTSVSAV